LTYDLRIVNGRICTSYGTFYGNIGVEDGKIACISKTHMDAERTIDAEGLLILPGAVDVHYHCRDPGYTYREDFETGTRAAASGGTTTILEMPVSMPPVHNGSILERRRKLASKKSYVDFGLYGGCGTLNKEDIMEQKEKGAIGYKVFLHEPPPGKEEMMRGLCITNDLDLMKALQLIHETSLLISVHAEDAAIQKFLARKMKEEGRKDPLSFCDTSPEIAEELAVYKIITIVKLLKTKVHFAHITSARSLCLIREAKNSGVDVSAETCPHYLLFTKDDLRRLGPYAKVSPPLRTEEDVEALWGAINDGTIDIIASDHAPYRRDEKEKGLDDIWLAPAGLPGGELLTSIILSKSLEGRISLRRAVEVLSKNPARRFGLHNEKGDIKVGADADLILFDPKKEWVVDHNEMLTKSKDGALLYHGLKLRGKIMRVFLRGNEIYSEGAVVGRPGEGRFVSPSEDKVKF
jgi:dihydropyrimidinase/allantoinase